METIPGGRYLSADGKTFHDANGKTLAETPKTIEPREVEPGKVLESVTPENPAVSETPIAKPKRPYHRKNKVSTNVETKEIANG